jgi:hypothetical protein
MGSKQSRAAAAAAKKAAAADILQELPLPSESVDPMGDMERIVQSSIMTIASLETLMQPNASTEDGKSFLEATKQELKALNAALKAQMEGADRVFTNDGEEVRPEQCKNYVAVVTKNYTTAKGKREETARILLALEARIAQAGKVLDTPHMREIVEFRKANPKASSPKLNQYFGTLSTKLETVLPQLESKLAKLQASLISVDKRLKGMRSGALLRSTAWCDNYGISAHDDLAKALEPVQ